MQLPHLGRAVGRSRAARKTLSALALALALAGVLGFGWAFSQPAQPMLGDMVNVVNRSRVTACAEEDNVDFELARPKIAGFTLRVSYPDYIDDLGAEDLKPDFHGCHFNFTHKPGAPKPARPAEVTFYRSPDLWLVGVMVPNFWRANHVPVIVGTSRVFAPLVQVWVKAKGKGEQIIAFYPPDGYWRFRPLPYGRQRFSSYGSSILIGPVERGAERPYVAIKQVVFDPRQRSFRLDFADGGAAVLTLRSIDDHDCTISVAFSGVLPDDRAFAAIRSMFVDEKHADVARIRWTKGQPAELVSAFQKREVSRLWMGRSLEPLHNNTAPDHLFSDFIVKD